VTKTKLENTTWRQPAGKQEYVKPVNLFHAAESIVPCLQFFFSTKNKI